HKVGLVGHSRTGYLTYYAITHPGKVSLAAAEVWDAATASFPQYLEEAVAQGAPLGYEYVNGGNFWQNKSAWLQHDVLFNVDRVEAATLFVDAGNAWRSRSAETAAGMETYQLMTMGAFQLNQRPLEYLFIPNGGHILPGYAERKAAMDATV